MPAKKGKASRKKMTQAEYAKLSVAKQVENLISAIESSEKLPWRSVYQLMAPISMRKYVEARDRLESTNIPEAKHHDLAVRFAKFRGANALSVMAEGMARGKRAPIMGTYKYVTELLPDKYVSEGFERPHLKGAKSVAINSFFPLKKKDEETAQSKPDKPSKEEVGDDRTPMGFTAHYEFFIDDMHGVKFESFFRKQPEQSFDPDKLEELMHGVSAELGVPIEDGLAGKPACYVQRVNALTNEIVNCAVQLPPKESFVTLSEYYAAAFHELAHAAHAQMEPEVFSRELAPGSRFEGMTDKQIAAYKEIVAEFSSALLMIDTGVAIESEQKNSAAYVAQFKRSLRDLSAAGFEALVYRAGGKAQQVVSQMTSGSPYQSVNLEQYLQQRQERAEAAIQEHKERVAQWAGKEVDQLVPEDFPAYAKAEMGGFNPVAVLGDEAPESEREVARRPAPSPSPSGRTIAPSPG